jgi:hypothetical protein
LIAIAPQEDKMDTQTLIFWFILDPITFGLGSIGAYLIFQEFAGLDHFPPTPHDILFIIKKRWLACLALAVAVVYFFYRLFTVLGR